MSRPMYTEYLNLKVDKPLKDKILYYRDKINLSRSLNLSQADIVREILYLAFEGEEDYIIDSIVKNFLSEKW